MPCVFLIGEKRRLLFQGWFQKQSRQEQHPGCSVHKDLTLRMVWKPDKMEYFSYFLYSWKNMKNHRSAFITIFRFQRLPYLKKEEEEIKRVLPTPLTFFFPPSFPPFSWTRLRYLTEKLSVLHRGWEHAEGTIRCLFREIIEQRSVVLRGRAETTLGQTLGTLSK